MARRRRGNTKLGRCAKSGRGLTRGKFKAHMKSCMRKRR
jgi:hypothetical protein